MTWRNIVLVAIGGGLGAVLRDLVSLWMPGGAIPWAFLLINTVGSYAIGIIAALVDEFGRLSPQSRLFLAVGVMGGFTTFSTYMAGVHDLIASQHLVRGILYGVWSPIMGFVAAWGGIVSVRLGMGYLSRYRGE